MGRIWWAASIADRSLRPMAREGLAKCTTAFSSTGFRVAHPATSARRGVEGNPLFPVTMKAEGQVVSGVDVHPRKCILWSQSSASSRSKMFGKLDLGAFLICHVSQR
jgi:hypothetical protein